MEDLIHQIRALSNTNRRDILRLHCVLVQSAELLQSESVHALASIMDTLDPSLHSLGYLYLLDVFTSDRISKEHTQYSVWLIDRFIKNCCEEQIKLERHKFTSVCKRLKDLLLLLEEPFQDVTVMWTVVRKLQASSENFTTLHSDFLLLCIVAKRDEIRSCLLFDDILKVDQQPRDLFLYYYHGGIIRTGLKEFQRAYELLGYVVFAPMSSLNAIAVDAYRKYILLSLIQYGQFSTSSYLRTDLKNCAQLYLDLASSYSNGNISELEAFVNNNQKKFKADNNLGLVKQAVLSMCKRNIQKLAQPNLTLSMQDIASSVQLNSAKEVEMHVLEMIQDGEIYATINQDAMVEFLEDPKQAIINDQTRLPVKFLPDLDVAEYAGGYTGKTKISRLLFISENCGNSEMCLEALKIAYEELKKRENIKDLENVVKLIEEKTDDPIPDYGLDLNWVEEVRLRSQQKEHRLEQELNFYQSTTLAYQKCRVLKELGDFNYTKGDKDKTLKYYRQISEYRQELEAVTYVDMLVDLMSIYVDMDKLDLAKSVILSVEVEDIPLHLRRSLWGAKLACVEGLVLLKERMYKAAAKKFLNPVAMAFRITNPISGEDMGTYGGLCALATFNRQEIEEIKDVLMEDVVQSFKSDWMPEVRELILEFLERNFKNCFEYLRVLKQKLLLDIHLHDHVEALFSHIRTNSILHYAEPYKSIDLSIMAFHFNTDILTLEKEVEALIINNIIQGYIDCQKHLCMATFSGEVHLTEKDFPVEIDPLDPC